jgi:hypothetical protein
MRRALKIGVGRDSESRVSEIDVGRRDADCSPYKADEKKEEK